MSAAHKPIHARIVLLGGDGIGPEVVAEAHAVLTAIAERFGHTFHYDEALIGGAAIDAGLPPLPDETLTLCRVADAVVLGAVGGPKWDSVTATVRPEQGLLAIRRGLGLYANLRPVRGRPSLDACSPFKPAHLADVDFVVVRELTGGIYFGEKALIMTSAGEQATDVCTYTTPEVERIVRTAAKIARTRRGKLTSVDKANVLETSRLWRRVVTRVMAEEFSDVALDHMLVDTCAMKLVQAPASFDVVVTENMFGDILTDEAAMLAGSIGLLPSASLGAPRDDGSRAGLYEPIHGSAPDIVGKKAANPIGTILSVAMLLRYSLSLEREARMIEHAVDATLDAGVLTADLVQAPGVGVTTGEVTEAIISRLSGG